MRAPRLAQLLGVGLGQGLESRLLVALEPRLGLAQRRVSFQRRLLRCLRYGGVALGLAARARSWSSFRPLASSARSSAARASARASAARASAVFSSMDTPRASSAARTSSRSRATSPLKL